MSSHILIPVEKVTVFCQHHPIRKLALFGSVLRDDFSPESDIDVLVEFLPDARISLLDSDGRLTYARRRNLAVISGRKL